MPARTRRQEQAQATREAFLAAARALFAERGYAATSVEEITGRLSAARGALYHHFESKQALFRAVLERVEGEIAQAMFAASAGAGRSAWERATAACDAFLRVCSDPGVQRIFLVDARALPHDPEGARRLYVLAEQALRAIFRDTPDAGFDFAPATYALLGALQGLAQYVADADDAADAHARARRTLRQLLAGLREAADWSRTPGAGPA